MDIYWVKILVLILEQLLLVGHVAMRVVDVTILWMRNQELYQIVKMQRSIENL